MKKLYVVVLAFCMMAGTLNAQKYYARVGFGLGIGLSSYDGQTGNQTVTSTSNVTEIKSGSLGTGLNINFGGGYMFSKFIGVDLGFNEFIGFGVKTEYSQNQGIYYSQQWDDKYVCKSFRIIPALVITPGFEKINPYGRFGLMIGIINHTNYSYTNTQTAMPELKASNTTIEEYKDKDYGGISLGFAAAVGADFNLSKNFAFYAEINMNGINYSPKKGKVEEWTVNGVDQIPLSTTKDLEWEYVKTLDSEVDIPDSSPDQYLKETALLTNIGFSIGAKFRFGKAN